MHAPVAAATLRPWRRALGTLILKRHRQGHEAFATGGLLLGFVLMMVLDTALG